MRWKLNRVGDGGLFPANSEWSDVREYIRARRPDPKPAPEDIRVRPRFRAHFDRFFADVFGAPRAPFFTGHSFAREEAQMSLITEIG